MPDRPIKLFVDAHILDKGYHGTHTFVKELYAELIRRYKDLDIYFGTYDVDLVKALFPEVDASHILAYTRRKPTFLRFLIDIPRYLRQYGFDYAHFQYIGLQWRTPCVSIVTIHDVLFNDFPHHFPWAYRWARKLLFAGSVRRAGIMTTVSPYSRGRISRHYRIPEERIHVIPNAVNERSGSPFPSREAAVARIREKYGLSNFILYVSRLEPRKNHLLLLNTYFSLRLHEAAIPLVFIGEESIRIPGMARRLQHLTPEQRQAIYWFPKVDPEDLTAFYTSCRLFIYPSMAEGFGIPPLEAAMCGAPVLCSRDTAMRSYQFFDPYMFDPASGPDMAERLTEMIRHPPGSDFLKAVSVQVASQYSLKGSAQAFYSLIRQRDNT
jgi:glycosyltransferase involved in cell wall biosynthesis